MWETAGGRSPVQQAVELLAVAYPETTRDEWSRQSVGRRDAGLLALRERLFGTQLVSLAACPACGELTEFTVEAAQIRAAPSVDVGEPIVMTRGGCLVRFRLPNSLDLAAIETASSVDEARDMLLQRCVLAAERDGQPLTAAQLPSETVEGVVNQMAESDGQADIRLACRCPRCEHVWLAAFDIVSYLWTEISAWAKRTLREIHVLASAYGWREADILALSAARRQTYLQLISDE